MLGLDNPVVVQAMLYWVLTVTLAEVIWFIFLEDNPWLEIWL